MTEQDFNQWLRDKTDATPIPEALLPEHITDHLSTEALNITKSRKWYQHPWMNAVAGFLLLGIITSGIWLVSITQHSTTTETTNHAGQEMQDESISDTNASLTIEEACTSINEAEDFISPIQTATDYQQLHTILSDSLLRYDKYFAVTDLSTDVAMRESSAESAIQNDSTTNHLSDSTLSATSKKADYYDTNSQVEQVVEADIVKTDGSYIYTCYQQQNNEMNAVAIAKASNGILTASSTISQESIAEAIQCDDFSIADMYVNNQQLILLCNGVTPTESDEGYSMPDTSEDFLYDSICCEYAPNYNTYILTYDISNPEEPTFLASVVQDGTYATSRLINGYLYTFSNKYVSIPDDYQKYDNYIPHTNETLLSCDDIYLPECLDLSSYQIMTSMCLDQPKQFVSSKAILSGNGTYYVSENHIYFAQGNWETGVVETEILKFSYENGFINPVGTTTINGYLINQFSMDEYDGYLRVATTTTQNGNANALYLIDCDMNVVGTIDNLAPDEQIYSVRFIDETGYFVTYRQTDPLFAVNLSNPEAPQITDALKIPGFSNYLHFYSDDLLFGLGEETNPSTGEFLGVKLSMFDISDPYQLAEVDKVVLSDSYYSAAQYNHKALMIDPERNLIGFYTEQYDDVNYEYSEYYMIYSYQPGTGFIEEFACNLSEEQTLSGVLDSYKMSFYNTRGLYIGDYLYLVNGNHICSYSLDSYKKIDGIIL